MGVVFLGSKGSKRVAVKVVRSSFLDNPSLRTRFEREIATLKKMRSESVAEYLDSDVEGELAWHAVEFINGPTLKERIEHDGPMSPDEWWVFYESLRTALSDIHALGITHRDLKPSNIILSETGIKLIDFGIAQDSDATSITNTGTVTGSSAWLSPEHLEGTELGPASDLFAAGSILVYAAKGTSPWGDETTMTVPVAFQRILSLDLRLDGLNPDFEPAVRALLRADPNKRTFGHNSLSSAPGRAIQEPNPTGKFGQERERESARGSRKKVGTPAPSNRSPRKQSMIRKGGFVFTIVISFFAVAAFSAYLLTTPNEETETVGDDTTAKSTSAVQESVNVAPKCQRLLDNFAYVASVPADGIFELRVFSNPDCLTRTDEMNANVYVEARLDSFLPMEETTLRSFGFPYSTSPNLGVCSGGESLGRTESEPDYSARQIRAAGRDVFSEKFVLKGLSPLVFSCEGGDTLDIRATSLQLSASLRGEEMQDFFRPLSPGQTIGNWSPD